MKRSKRLLNTTFFLALSALLAIPILINAISAYAIAPPTYKSQFGATLGDDQFLLGQPELQ